jgi:hypothetical protein
MATYSLTWDAASVGGALSVDDHDVEYTPSGGSATVVSTSSASNSHAISGLADGVAHSFRVRAKDGSVAGPWSAAVSAGGGAASTTELVFNFNNSLADSGPNSYVLNSASGTGFDSTNKAFGSHSRAYQPYTSDSISNQGAAVTAMFSGDFTVECFYRLNPGSLGSTIFAAGVWGTVDNTGNTFDGMTVFADNYSSNYIGFYWYNGASSSGTVYSTTPMVDDGAFRHIAVVREGTTWRVYYDGARIIENTAATNADPWTSQDQTLAIGIDPYMMGYDGTDGNIDDFRVSTSALYSGATITVPTAELS